MKKLKHLSTDLRGAVQGNYQRVIVGSGLLITAGAANATEPVNHVADAFAQLSTEVSNMFGEAWPVLVAITVGFIGMKIFKKGANKAT